METTYYDNEAGDFNRLHWTFRRRMENGKSICTLKTPMEGLGRAEFETECGDILEAVPQLLRLGAPKQLLLLTCRGVFPSCGARFIRLAGPIEGEGFTAELALDEGVLLGGGKELPFAEVEVELKAGSEEAVTAFANALAAEYGLRPEPRSKVARARLLVQK
jgi:inorganic triphosphatase YgiF